MYICKSIFRPIVCLLRSKTPDELKDLTGFHTGNTSSEPKCIDNEESCRPFADCVPLGMCHVIPNGPAEFASHHNYGNHLGHISSKDNRAKRHLLKLFEAAYREQCAASRHAEDWIVGHNNSPLRVPRSVKETTLLTRHALHHAGADAWR